LSCDIEIHRDAEKDRSLDLSFSSSSMWIFIHRSECIEASYRVNLGTLREMARWINQHVEMYADRKTGPDGEVLP